MDELVSSIVLSVSPLTDLRFAFFGHSLGALVAFEVAHRLRHLHGFEPDALFVSSRRAPHLSAADQPKLPLTDHAVIERLKGLNGTPDEVLENSELMEVLLPAIKADFEMDLHYQYVARPPLSCPVVALGGSSDSCVPTDHLCAWKEITSGAFSLYLFPGDHFHIRKSDEKLVGIILNHF